MQPKSSETLSVEEREARTEGWFGSRILTELDGSTLRAGAAWNESWQAARTFYRSGLERAERERDEVIRRLRELVRLRDLKDHAPEEYALEEEGAAKAEAWHQARETLARLRSQKGEER